MQKLLKLLAFYLIINGFVCSPRDGQIAKSPDQTITFQGFSTNPGSEIELFVKAASNVNVRIATTTSNANSTATSDDGVSFYSWTASAKIDSNRWKLGTYRYFAEIKAIDRSTNRVLRLAKKDLSECYGKYKTLPVFERNCLKPQSQFFKIEADLRGNEQPTNVVINAEWENGRYERNYNIKMVGFTKAHRDKITKAIDTIYDVITDPAIQAADHPFRECVNEKAKTFLQPVWNDTFDADESYTFIRSGLEVISSTGGRIESFTQREKVGGRDFIVGGTAYVPTELVEGDLSIRLNNHTIEKTTHANLARLIFHEWLHRMGFKHGSSGKKDQDYKGPFIAEADRCFFQEVNRRLRKFRSPQADLPYDELFFD